MVWKVPLTTSLDVVSETSSSKVVSAAIWDAVVRLPLTVRVTLLLTVTVDPRGTTRVTSAGTVRSEVMVTSVPVMVTTSPGCAPARAVATLV